MSRGTKVFLALFAIFICVLVWYYARTSRTPGDQRALNDAVERPQDPTAPDARPQAMKTEPIPAAPSRSQAAAQPRQPETLTRTSNIPTRSTRSGRPTVTMGEPLPPGLVPARPDSTTAPSARPGTRSEAITPRTAPARPAVSTPPPTRTGLTYTVKSGDTPGSIAAAWFGEINAWHLIIEANPGLDARNLQIGQVLNMPPKSAAARQPAATSDRQTGTYTVRPGDSLSRIADRVYGDSSRWREIFDANRDQLSGPHDLDPGQRLTIPR